MNKHQVEIDTTKCIGCGLCVKTCVAHNIELKNKKAGIVLDDCIMCGQCTAVCPKEAIFISGYDMEQIQTDKGVRLKPDEVLDVIRFRRTIRQFQDKEISKQVMAIGIFKMVKPFANLFSPMTRRNKIGDHFFFFKAPIVIVILAKDKTNGLLAAQNMKFVAEANGLGVLYSGFFTMAANISFKIKRALGVPKGKRVAMTLVLGYPKARFLRSAPREKLDVRYM